MKESRLTTIARRGLALPAETLEQIRKTGIRCRPQLDVVYQQHAKAWKLRGEESGGAVELLGHYVGFVGAGRLRRSVAATSPELSPERNARCDRGRRIRARRDVPFREHLRSADYQTLARTPGRQTGGTAEQRSSFSAATAFLKPNFGARTRPFAAAPCLTFLTRSGEPGPPEPRWTDATLKVTEAVCCCGCRHSHLLEAAPVVVTSPIILPNEKDSVAKMR